jgi:hypothetical protein
VGDDPLSSQQHQWIGVLLIAGQSDMSILQDLSEEILMQEAEFPATMLLELEGLFGLVLGSIFYFPLAAQLGEPLSNTVNELRTCPPLFGDWCAQYRCNCGHVLHDSQCMEELSYDPSLDVWIGHLLRNPKQRAWRGMVVPRVLHCVVGLWRHVVYSAHVQYSNKEETPLGV